MIYIDLKGKVPPDEWSDKAEAVTNELLKAKTFKERQEIIDKNSSLWRELKKWLMKINHDKCWYTEAREKVSFYDVDHFRPKKRAKQLDCTQREGYWWLAFDWKNYRISGQICNRPNSDEQGITRGKGDYFPVKKYIARSPNDDINDEIVFFLDPTNEFDTLLITFDEEGRAIPTSKKGTWSYERAEVTIKYLHLDYYILVSERKKVWNRCKTKIIEAENLLNKDISATVQANIINIFNELKEMISVDAELSSTARACMESLGGPVVKALLTKH